LELSVKKAVDRISINSRIKTYMDDLEGLIRVKDKTIDESQSLVTIGQTVAGMSHVIKNIAGGLKGSSFILEQGIENENREYLVKGWEMMKGNIDKITNLSLDLLNYAKTSRLKLKKINPNQPVLELMDLLKPRAIEKEIIFTLSPLEEEFFVLMDKDAIYNGIFNLITNAFDSFGENTKHLKNLEKPDKARQVKVSVEKETAWIAYRVRDNGKGVDENISQSLFKEFITTKGTQGTGFGLMTTQKIIDEHKGQLFFETRKGKGSVFTIKLPLQHSNGITPSPMGHNKV
jgi:signal transduction histidine kinase